MLDEDVLSSVLREFARTLVTDVPVQQVLDHLVDRIVGIRPIASAGVTLVAAGREPRSLAAPNASAFTFERLQTALGEGLDVLAFSSGGPVAMVDLASGHRFPTFTAAGWDAGPGAVFALPLHHGANRPGALDISCESPGELDAATMETAQVPADVVVSDLINAQARDEARPAAKKHRSQAMHDGHVGDTLLVAVARRLEALARPSYTLARVGRRVRLLV